MYNTKGGVILKAVLHSNIGFILNYIWYHIKYKIWLCKAFGGFQDVTTKAYLSTSPFVRRTLIYGLFLIFEPINDLIFYASANTGPPKVILLHIYKLKKNYKKKKVVICLNTSPINTKVNHNPTPSPDPSNSWYS